MKLRHRYPFYIAVAVGMAVIAAIASPRLTFPGRYQHAPSGTVYEFRDGRLLENGRLVGAYSATLSTLSVSMEHADTERVISGVIGWNTVSLDLPEYGPSRLLKVDAKDPPVSSPD